MAVARRYNKVRMAIPCEVSSRKKIGIDRNANNLGFCKKRLWELALSYSLKSGIALRSKGIQIASMQDQNSTSGCLITNHQVLDAAPTKIAFGHRKWLWLQRRKIWTSRCEQILNSGRWHVRHLQTLGIGQPDSGPFGTQALSTLESSRPHRRNLALRHLGRG
jgi:hypothetical protein